MKTLVDLPDDLVRDLDALAKRRNWSRAEALRQGANALIVADQARLEAALDAVFGMWKDRGIDGVTYQRALRDEWDD